MVDLDISLFSAIFFWGEGGGCFFVLVLFSQILMIASKAYLTQKQCICHSHSSSEELHRDPMTLKILL